MITPDDDVQSPIMRREASLRPPRSLSHWFIGRPLPTADALHQTIGKAIGLAVFASDALSSTAYASQEMMVILAAAGTLAFRYTFPISIAIVCLLIIVTLSYRQTIFAYPNGGGAYIVAKENLGTVPGLMAAAALLTDYILTVSVSISSGVAQIISAIPSLIEYRVLIAVIAVMLIMVINLRGVRESGITFAIPTYLFIVVMVANVLVGMIRYLTNSLGTVQNPPELVLSGELVAITPFLLLHAFSNGTAALTGIEAISNGITAFKEPRSRNAATVLSWLAAILSFLFLGISFLAYHIGAIPSEEETVISQLARTVFEGRGLLYLLSITVATLILVLAANTAFAGFPRLSALVAQDRFLPRQLTYRGSRLVYSRGIVALGVIASLPIIVFKASVTRLIPLYAIGVFLSFTLSQFGMTQYWRRAARIKPDEETHNRKAEYVQRNESHWFLKSAINGFGAVCTAMVMVIFSVTKFKDGAWMVLLLTPTLMWVFGRIHHHYRVLADHLSLDQYGGPPPQTTRHRVIMPIGGVHRGTLEALRYARMLSDDITAVHVSVDPEEAAKVQQRWEKWGDGVRLVILDSPYRLFLEPLLDYIEEITGQRQPNETITILVPQFVPSKRWHNSLHTQTARLLRSELLAKPGVVVTSVPYHV